jgi:UDPglucose 6-dehydrogenase
MNNVKRIYEDKISFSEDQYSATKDADALIIATEWSLFRTPDFEILGSNLKNKVIFDGRNLYSLDQMKNLGYYYSSIGRELVE